MKRQLLSLWGALPLPGIVRRALVLLAVNKFPVGVTGVVRNASGRFLMFRHTYRGRYPWGLPSGWLKAGEAPEAAICREIEEETGLLVSVEHPLLVRSATETRHLDIVYLCRLDGGAFRPSAEVVEMGWFGRDDLPSLHDTQYVMMGEILKALEKERDV